MAQDSGFKLTIDTRERLLATLFGNGGAVEVSTLELGDVMCQYPDDNSWILERKTVSNC